IPLRNSRSVCVGSEPSIAPSKWALSGAVRAALACPDGPCCLPEAGDRTVGLAGAAASDLDVLLSPALFGPAEALPDEPKKAAASRRLAIHAPSNARRRRVLTIRFPLPFLWARSSHPLGCFYTVRT